MSGATNLECADGDALDVRQTSVCRFVIRYAIGDDKLKFVGQ